MEKQEDIDQAVPGEEVSESHFMCTNKKSLKREDVMTEMQPLLSRLRDKWTEELAADIAATLTPQKLQVLEPQAKGLFAGWIYQQEDQKYMQWLKAAEADATSVTWDEETIIPGPEYWSSTITMTHLIKDLEQAVEENLSPEHRPRFQHSLLVLKGFTVCVGWHQQQRKEFPILNSGTVHLLRHNDGIKSYWPIDQQP